MQIVPFSAEHTAAAAQLERLCFTDPWSENGLLTFTKSPGSGVVCLENGIVTAYAGMVGIPDEGEIVRVAVHPAHRRRGYGRAVLESLICDGVKKGFRHFLLEVRKSNAAAVCLYASEGFSVSGTRKNFYTRPVEDALIMTRTEGN